MVDYLSGKSTITTSPLSYCDRNQAKDFRLQRQAVISRKAPYPTARTRGLTGAGNRAMPFACLPPSLAARRHGAAPSMPSRMCWRRPATCARAMSLSATGAQACASIRRLARAHRDHAARSCHPRRTLHAHRRDKAAPVFIDRCNSLLRRQLFHRGRERAARQSKRTDFPKARSPTFQNTSLVMRRQPLCFVDGGAGLFPACRRRAYRPACRRDLGASPSARVRRLPPKKTDAVSRRWRREDRVAFSVPEKPPDACTPRSRRRPGLHQLMQPSATKKGRQTMSRKLKKIRFRLTVETQEILDWSYRRNCAVGRKRRSRPSRNSRCRF